MVALMLQMDPTLEDGRYKILLSKEATRLEPPVLPVREKTIGSLMIRQLATLIHHSPVLGGMALFVLRVGRKWLVEQLTK